MSLMTYRPIKSEPVDSRLGRFIPDDWDHIEKHPFTVRSISARSVNVEKVLRLPHWHNTHDQGREGSCVGHAVAMERAITNTNQNSLAKIPGWKTRRYDPIWIWNGAKTIDEWEETNPGDENGTSVRAAYQHILDNGVVRVKNMRMTGAGVPVPVGSYPPDFKDSVLSFQWARKVDDMRIAIHNDIPVVIGVNWFRNFNNPELRTGTRNEYWIGRGNLGLLEGGHGVTVYGASDRRQAFRVKNNWIDYPLVWLPYNIMSGLFADYGEAALVVDR